MKRQLLIFALLFGALHCLAFGQIAQPYLTGTAPTGAQRGQQVTLTIEGFNLSGATAVLWNRPGITARIVLNAETAREAPRASTDPTKRYQGDRGTRNRVQIEATIAPEAAAGDYLFRLVTPLGTTNTGSFVVGALRETMEREANDALSEAQPITLPTTVLGEMQELGDRDSFRFAAKAGQQLVFEVVASAFGSRLDSVLTLYDGAGRQLATNNDAGSGRDSLLAHVIQESGEYAIQITDYEKRGKGRRAEFAYRLNIGELPWIAGHFPLGFRQGEAGMLALAGQNLGAEKAAFQAPVKEAWNPAHLFRVEERGLASNPIRLALGTAPEIVERAGAKSLASPQPVSVPVTINGRISAASTGAADAEDHYRFAARKGQTLLLEVGAQRFGSPLDAVIEIYNSRGQLVPRAILRCLLETSQTLNDRDSSSRGIRILSWNGIQPDDYLLIGNELLQVDVLPKGPDEDTFFKSFNGQRIGFLDTTPEAHAVNTPIYKVSIHPPDAQLPSNGLPQVTLHYRNDDGGPMYGKDSGLMFTAPEDGEYTVRLRDVRGWHGEAFAYRLTIREPRPDFSLTVDPENPNVPPGGAIPIHVTAFRAEGFTGEIEIALRDLPAGFTATSGVIREGVNTATLLLRAAADVSPQASFPLKVEGVATIQGRRVARAPVVQERLAVVSVSASPELLVWTEQPQVRLEPGGTAWVSIRVKREKEFKGRIPFDIRNLPHGVIVRDVGLSGVLITEDETTQRFELSAEPWARPLQQPIIVIGRVETASPQRSEFPAQPFTLIIDPKRP
ncbi:MAG: PPC domain-containing protein [Blastocatellia bacterium]|nr:PPC domain-containing protein [Blastocatellia bacterium]